MPGVTPAPDIRAEYNLRNTVKLWVMFRKVQIGLQSSASQSGARLVSRWILEILVSEYLSSAQKERYHEVSLTIAFQAAIDTNSTHLTRNWLSILT